MDVASGPPGPPAGIRFCSLAARHLPPVVRIIRAGMAEFLSESPDPEDLAAQLTADYPPPRCGFFVVLSEAGDEVLGGGGFRHLPTMNRHPPASTSTPSTCELQRMYLTPAARGRGIGRRFLAFLLDRARSAGHRVVRLETASTMTTARALYRDAGFVETPHGSTGSGCDRRLELFLP